MEQLSFLFPGELDEADRRSTENTKSSDRKCAEDNSGKQDAGSKVTGVTQDNPSDED